MLPAEDEIRFISFTSYKINSKWIKHLNLKPETCKVSEQSTGVTLRDTGVGKNALNRTPAAQEVTPSVNRWESVKVKFLFSKGNNQ